MSRAHRALLRSSNRVKWLLLACVLALPSLAACSRDDSKGTSSTQKLTGEDGSTGVPLCDSYLDQYETCVIPTLPPSQVQRHHEGIVRQRQSWAALASSPAKQQSLMRICASAIDTARREFPSCDFPGG